MHLPPLVPPRWINAQELERALRLAMTEEGGRLRAVYHSPSAVRWWSMLARTGGIAAVQSMVVPGGRDVQQVVEAANDALPIFVIRVRVI